ncbi:MAG: efflux transporter outer membrane subunit [Steroidobacteraceae bacterium]
MIHASTLTALPGCKRLGTAIATSTLLLMAACTAHAPLKALPDKPADSLAFSRTVGSAAQGQWPEREWWNVYGDAQLGSLIKEGLAANPDMDAALARIQAADARAAGTRAPLIPTIEANVGSQRTLFSENGFLPPPIGGSTIWQNKASLDLRWEIDFWGKHKSALAGALRDTAAASIDKESAELALSTSIARRYVEWQRIEEQLELGRALVKQRESLLGLTQKRVTAGLDSNVQLRAAEAAVPDTRADIAALETQASIARIELAALVGAGPDRGLDLTRPALKVPAAAGSPTAIPADLLARRPDVLARRLRAEAAASRADGAQADFYPNINLAAAVGLDSKTFTDWVDMGSKFYNAGPALNLPLFGGGRRRATLNLRTAEYDEAVAMYRQSLVGATRDVATALTDLRSVDTEQRDATAAVTAQTQSYDLARRRYEGGLGTMTDVLVAEASLLNQRRRIADLNARRLDASVRLVAALGGGLPLQTSLTAVQP